MCRVKKNTRGRGVGRPTTRARGEDWGDEEFGGGGEEGDEAMISKLPAAFKSNLQWVFQWLVTHEISTLELLICVARMGKVALLPCSSRNLAAIAAGGEVAGLTTRGGERQRQKAERKDAKDFTFHTVMCLMGLRVEVDVNNLLKEILDRKSTIAEAEAVSNLVAVLVIIYVRFYSRLSL
jgi:hypothetical protein